MTPLFTAPEMRVRPEWLDYNGHMNVAWYLRAFDLALEDFLISLGLGLSYLEERRGSTFTLENHIRYLREVKEGDTLRMQFHLLAFDDKRIHSLAYMHNAREDYLAATCEQVGMHIDMTRRRSAPFPSDIRARIAETARAHSALPRPPEAGRACSLARRSASG